MVQVGSLINGDLLSAANPLPVAQQAAASASGTLQQAAAATGNGTPLALLGMASCVFTVSGTFVGTVTFEGTEDGTNWSSLSATQLGTTSIVPTATAPGLYEASVAGLQSVRARVSAYTSGAITVTAHALPVAWSTRVHAVSQLPAAALAADALALPTTAEVLAANQLYNGATLDLQRNNIAGTLLASASRTAQTDSPQQTNFNARGVLLFLSISAITGGPGAGIQAFIWGTDAASGNSIGVSLGSGLKTTTGVYVVGMYPASTTVGGIVMTDVPLPRTWFARVTVSDATPYTYSLGYSYIV